MTSIRTAISLAALAALLSPPALASPTIFSTGSPDGLMAAASQPTASGLEIETADDFDLSTTTKLDGASFTGLLPSDSTVVNVTVEIYRVFPLDSDTVRTPQVNTRTNSPSDVAFLSRDSSDSSLTFTDAELSPSFTAANSVQPNGIHLKPNQLTGGNGAISGEETAFDITFTTPITLTAGHYFFVPQVQLDDGSFYWLSAPRPIVPPGTPFPSGVSDLQGWTRDENLDPDWSRIGTDIVGSGAFNFAFSLTAADTVPEPAAWSVLLVGFLGLGLAIRMRSDKPRQAYANIFNLPSSSTFPLPGHALWLARRR